MFKVGDTVNFINGSYFCAIEGHVYTVAKCDEWGVRLAEIPGYSFNIDNFVLSPSLDERIAQVEKELQELKEQKQKQESPVSYEIGNKFRIAGEDYILCSPKVGNVVLISLATGRPLHDMLPVDNLYPVPEEVVSKLCRPAKFTKI